MRKRALPTAVVMFLLIAGLAAADSGDWQRGQARGRGQGGPAFCRSGAGHPVFGRQWCLEKGFGLGGFGWRRATLGRIVFQRTPRGRVEGRIGAREIAEILTGAVLDEIFGERRGRGNRDRSRLAGAWRGGPDDGILVLELFDGDDAIAELADIDLDGDVDVVLIADQ